VCASTVPDFEAADRNEHGADALKHATRSVAAAHVDGVSRHKFLRGDLGFGLAVHISTQCVPAVLPPPVVVCAAVFAMSSKTSRQSYITSQPPVRYNDAAKRELYIRLTSPVKALHSQYLSHLISCAVLTATWGYTIPLPSSTRPS
jgi:hypothetical protein